MPRAIVPLRCLLTILLLINAIGNASASMPLMSSGSHPGPTRGEQVAASMQHKPCHSDEAAEQTDHAPASPLGEVVVADIGTSRDRVAPHGCCDDPDCEGHGCRCDCLIAGAALASIPSPMPRLLAIRAESIGMPSVHPAPPRRNTHRPPIG